MKYALAFVIVLTLAGNIAAQEEGVGPQPQPQQPPDFSRAKLTQIFANAPVKERVEPRIQWGIGFIDFRALRMRWRIAYLPIMIPLSGSMPWRSNGAFNTLPDPFELTGTEIASPPRTWRQTRDMSAELKRIEKTEKAKAKVVAKPE